MDAPVKELERLQALQKQAHERLEAGQLDEALASVEEALAIEAKNLRSLALKADVLERKGQAEEAGRLRLIAKQLKREAWERQVEAELRGKHDLMGEAIRHEKL
jgi:Tfp pilus assembly protein PilF